MDRETPPGKRNGRGSGMMSPGVVDDRIDGVRQGQRRRLAEACGGLLNNDDDGALVDGMAWHGVAWQIQTFPDPN